MSANPVDVLQSYGQSAPDAPALSVTARPWLDRIGITASVACAIHCLAAPLLLLLLPTAGSIWADPMVHWVLAVLVLPLALMVIYRGYRKHGKRLTLVSAVLGAALIVAGLIAPMVSTRPLITLPVPNLANLAMTQASTAGQVPPMLARPASATQPADQPAAASACTAACCESKADTPQEPTAAAAPSPPPAAIDPATDTCTDACCPTLAVNQDTGVATMGFPAGGILTMLGSVLLVLAHATNLHACRCFSRAHTDSHPSDDSPCGCPA